MSIFLVVPRGIALSESVNCRVARSDGVPTTFPEFRGSPILSIGNGKAIISLGVKKESQTALIVFW